MGRGRPMIGSPEEAAERRRKLTADRVRRLRERRRAEDPAAQPGPTPAPLLDEAMPVPPPSEGIAALHLRRYIESLECLDEELAKLTILRKRNPVLAGAYATERAAIQVDQKALWTEIEERGFSAAATREILRLRKIGEAERHEFEAVVGLYKQALGMD